MTEVKNESFINAVIDVDGKRFVSCNNTSSGIKAESGRLMAETLWIFDALRNLRTVRLER